MPNEIAFQKCKIYINSISCFYSMRFRNLLKNYENEPSKSHMVHFIGMKIFDICGVLQDWSYISFLFICVVINTYFIPAKTCLAVKILIRKIFPFDIKNTYNKFIIYNFV